MKYVGRPRKYETAEEMQVIVNEYFEECEKGDEVPTVTGLAYYLNIDRKQLLKYEDELECEKYKNMSDEEKVSFRNTVKRAKKYIEACYEQTLFKQGKTIGAIFTLKNNYNWVDKQEIVNSDKTIEVELVE